MELKINLISVGGEKSHMDSDSEVEAPDFTGPAAETADGGLILRKTKTKAGGGSHKKAGKSGPKIVF